MVDIKEYNLVFWLIEDGQRGQRFIGRRVCHGNYMIYDIFSGVKTPYTKKNLDKLFLTDVNNKKTQSRLFKRSA